MSSLFISHSSEDKEFARQLANDLKASGHEIWFDDDKILVGESIPSKIGEGIQKTDFLIVVLTKKSVESGWVETEWKSKYWDEVNSGCITVLPVLVERCNIPKLLESKKYADFRKNYPVGFADLIKAVSHPSYVASSCMLKKNNDIKTINYCWHRSVQEYFGLSLNLILIKFNSNTSYLDNNLANELEALDITNYAIYVLFSKWDSLIQFWTREESATVLANQLRGNTEIEIVNHIHVRQMRNLYNKEMKYPSNNEVIDTIEQIGVKGMVDLIKNNEKSSNYKMAISKGLLLRDSIIFDPCKIQFYLILKSLESIEEVSISSVMEKIRDYDLISSKTIYITSGSSIKMIIKGQSKDFYEIDRFNNLITSAISPSKPNSITTQTVFVSNEDVKISHDFSYIKAKENIVLKGYEDIIKNTKESIKNISIDVEKKYYLLSKYSSVIDILKIDDYGVIDNLMRAAIFNNPYYIKIIKDIFPEFEEMLKDNLVKVIMVLYGKDWQKHLDTIKNNQGIQKKQKDFTIGDVSKIYKQIFIDSDVFNFLYEEKEKFIFVMDSLPNHRNTLMHTSAKLEGWENLFDFCRDFLPIRHHFICYFNKIILN